MSDFAKFLGDAARPFAIIWTSLCGGVAFIISALKTNDGNDGAILVGAIGLIVTGIYGFKAVETWKGAKSEADVKIAQATGEEPKK